MIILIQVSVQAERFACCLLLRRPLGIPYPFACVRALVGREPAGAGPCGLDLHVNSGQERRRHLPTTEGGNANNALFPCPERVCSLGLRLRGAASFWPMHGRAHACDVTSQTSAWD